MGSLWLYKHMVQGLILGHINLSFSLFLFLFIINIVSEILKLNNLSIRTKQLNLYFSQCVPFSEVTLYTSEHILLTYISRTIYVPAPVSHRPWSDWPCTHKSWLCSPEQWPARTCPRKTSSSPNATYVHAWQR